MQTLLRKPGGQTSYTAQASYTRLRTRRKKIAGTRAGTEVAVPRCAMKRTLLGAMAFVVTLVFSAAPARAESMHLRALRVARQQFPGRTGARRITVAELPAAAPSIVAFRVIAEGIPPATYVVFTRDGAGWKSLGVCNQPDGRKLAESPRRRGRR